MLKYALVDRFKHEVTISLDVKSPHSRATIAYSGDESLVKRVKDKVSRSSGAFGHRIEDVTSAIDLHFALRGEEFKEYNPKMIEGVGIINKGYDPEIPEGAVT